MLHSGWKIMPMIAPEMMPSVIPGMAGIFMATATITMTGGKSSAGLILNTASSAPENSVTRLISASPP